LPNLILDQIRKHHDLIQVSGASDRGRRSGSLPSKNSLDTKDN